MAKYKEKFEPEKFITAFKKRQFAPVYFFCGEESFLIDETLDALVENAVDPAMKEFNFDLLHGGEIDGKRIVSLAASYPMMADRRVVIIKDFDRVREKEHVESYAEHPSESTVLVLIAGNPDFRKKPYSTFKKLNIVHEAAPLKDPDTMAWIGRRFASLKRTIEPAAAQLLFSYVGNSLQELANEIEKLLLSLPDGTAVSVKDVQRIVGVSREFSPFELSKKVGERNVARSIEIADRLIGAGESVVGVIAVLTLHFIKLWKVQDGLRTGMPESELATVASTNTYYLREYIDQAKKYRSGEIENIFVLLAEADLAAKSSGDPRVILTTLIARIVTGSSLLREESAPA